MRPLIHKIKPAGGISYLLHIALRASLPAVVFVLVRSLPVAFPALLVILLSKWRIFAVRPRFWPAILRANSVDLMVGVAVVVFMLNSGSVATQALWAVLYGIWLIFIKPSSTTLMVSLQAAIGLVAGLMALFVLSSDPFGFRFLFISWSSSLPLYMLVLLGGLICYLCARHFFDSFDEPYAKLLSYVWGYFGAALLWVLGHLIVVYPKQGGVVPQPVLFLVTIGYALAALYYLDHFDRLSKFIRKELMFITLMVVGILVLSLLYEGAHLIV